MMILRCTVEGCFNASENTDIGLCATHAREARKKAAPKTKPPKKRISKQSDPEREKIYLAIREMYLKENVICELCKKGIIRDGRQAATDVHHKKGRLGDLLYDVRHYFGVCRKHHQYIETHPEEAYEKGWSLLRNSNEPHEI